MSRRATPTSTHPMGTGEEIENALEKELFILRERLDEANVEREKLRCSQRAALARATVLERELGLSQSRLLNECERFNQTILELRTRTEELDTEANRLSDQLNQVLRSTSWKVTGPLRIAARRLPILAQLSRRFVARSVKLFCAAPDRADPIIPRPSSRVNNHAHAAGPSASVETEPDHADAFTKFVALQSLPGRKLGLVAAESPPIFDRDYAGLRLYNLVRAFHGPDRYLVFISQRTSEQFTATVGSLNECKRYEDLLYQAGIKYIAYGTEAEPLIRAVSGNLRWAYLLSSAIGDDLMPVLRLHAPWADIIYDMSGSSVLRAGPYEADLKQAPEFGACANQKLIIELTNARMADLTVVVSERERQELRKLDQELAVEVVPNPFDVTSNIELDISKRAGLLFLCRLWDPHSIEGVSWFVSEVWPVVRAKRPDAVLRIAGSTPPRSIRALCDQPGIDMLENTCNLIDLFTHSRMSVVPLRGGAKDSIGESLAHGLPVVATRAASEGMAVVHDEDLLIADTAIDFAREVLRLADVDALWRRLETNGRSFMQKQTDFARERLGALMNG